MENGEKNIGLNENQEAVSEDIFEGNHWELPNTVSAIEDAEKELKRRVFEAGWSEDEVKDFIEIAFHEALINAIVHGNLGVEQNKEGEALNWSEVISDESLEPAGNVEVSVDVGPEKIEVSVKDHGKGFAPEKVDDPTTGKNVWKTSGRGLKFIEHFSDDLEFSEGGTKITLIKEKS